MTSTVRRTVVRLSRDERMRDIVAAARKVFIERGFDAASTAEIAANAGVAEGTIYKYFESKRDVLLAVIEHIPFDQRAVLLGEFRRVLRAGGQVILTTPTPASRREAPRSRRRSASSSPRT